MNKYLDMAMSYAKDNDFERCLEYNLCALIVRGGSVVSVGYNKRGTNAFVEHYGDLAKGKRDWCLSTHAEMDAVLKARGKIDLKGCKVFVARRRKLDGVCANARPCVICESILQAYGISKAYYTIDPNNIGVMKPGKDSDKIIRINFQDQL